VFFNAYVITFNDITIKFAKNQEHRQNYSLDHALKLCCVVKNNNSINESFSLESADAEIKV
jgi:hypothetical protein